MSYISQVEINGIVMAYRLTNDIIRIVTTNLHSPTAANHDSHLNKNTLEIRVYE
jgi:tRNA G37 N-methylase TrmD